MEMEMGKNKKVQDRKEINEIRKRGSVQIQTVGVYTNITNLKKNGNVAKIKTSQYFCNRH